MIDLLMIASAFVVGIVIGLTGIGGGSLMTPTLILIFKVSPPVAVATDLFFAGFTKIVGTFEYARKRLVDWKIAGIMLLGSAPASIVTVLLMPENGEFAQTVKHVLSFALFLTSAVIFLKPYLNRRMNPSGALIRYREVLMVVFGMLLGVLVTLSSVGAGALGLALLTVLYPERKLSELVAVDLAHTVFLSFIAGMGHLSADNVDLALLGKLLLGSIPGVYLGSRLHVRVNERWIGVILLFVAIWLALASS